nr:immunoglobulin light chain junction region [Macaca mulatta]MOX41903.1 immunoglobulin light chain junction region [Macaca mulatta]MOX41954.1 immunoglobulin light chain junction region [Macaca mulatta]MOX42039.1 immunoglobulin light chain junction region [Macaca mulatta]MOX42430.1 immunoglobulin light chain junction region [Macaca mulatta]
DYYCSSYATSSIYIF